MASPFRTSSGASASSSPSRARASNSSALSTPTCCRRPAAYRPGRPPRATGCHHGRRGPTGPPQPVRYECATDALERAEPHGVWGGLTVTDRRAVAAAYGYPGAAQHGTRSRYVAGCHCPDCTRSHATYEHERRLHLRQSGPLPDPCYELAPAQPPPRPVASDDQFLLDLEAAELGIEETVSSDDTAVELGRMIRRADAAGMTEADLRPPHGRQGRLRLAAGRADPSPAPGTTTPEAGPRVRIAATRTRLHSG